MDAPPSDRLSALRRTMKYVSAGGLGPSLVRATAGTGAVQVGGMVATFAVGILLARILGVAGYGTYAIAMAVISLAGIPGEFGVPRLVVRETAAALTRKDWPTFFGVLRWAEWICRNVAIPIALLVAAAGFALLAGGRSAVGIAILCGAPVIPLFALAKVRGAALQGLHHVARGQVAPVLLRPLLLSLLLFALLIAGTRVDAATAMALNSVTALAALLLSHHWLRQRLPAQRPPKLVSHGRGWAASAIPLGLSEGARVIGAQVAILLLGLLSSTEEVGLFRIAASTAIMLIVPMTVVSIVASPTISRLHAEGDRQRLQTLVSRAAQAQFAGVVALSLPLLIAGEPVLGFVFGAEYRDAAGPLRLILAGQILNAAFGPNAPLLNMTHHERRVTRALTVGLVLNVVTVAALAPVFGMYGAAVGFVVSMTSWNLIAWSDARRLLGLDTSLLSSRAAFSRDASYPAQGRDGRSGGPLG